MKNHSSTLEKDVSAPKAEGTSSGRSESTTVSHAVGNTTSAVSETIASQEEKPNRPVQTFIAENGIVSASVWVREVQFKGQPKTFYSISLQRSFQDKKGKTRYTGYLDASNLDDAIALAKKAKAFVRGLQPPAPEPLPDQAD
jgi:hypothetical protein